MLGRQQITKYDQRMPPTSALSVYSLRYHSLKITYGLLR